MGFAQHIDYLDGTAGLTTVGSSGYTAGSGSMPLATGTATTFLNGITPTAANPVRFSVSSAATPSTVTHYSCTGVSGDSLTGVSVLKGTDRNYLSGDTVYSSVYAEDLTDIESAVATLQTDVGTVPAGILKGASGALAAAVAGTDYVVPSGSITGSADTITGSITESQVTGLTAALAALAPLASPVLTGTPKAPTAAVGTDTTQIATTAFVASVQALADLASVGTIATGTWQGTAIAPAYLTALGASGAGHSAGICPDPGATSGTTRYLREDATWDTPSGGGVTPDVQVFESSGTWTNPGAGYTRTLVRAIGGGGGGGGGSQAAASGTVAHGGSAAGAGAYVEDWLDTQSLPSTVAVTVGAGGAGGAPANGGGAGSATTFGSYLTALGGASGSGIYPGGNAVGTRYQSSAAGNSSPSGGAGAGANAPGSPSGVPGPGGAGGGIPSSPSAQAGGAGANSTGPTLATGGAGATSDGQAGGAGSASGTWADQCAPGSGGGGGASSILTNGGAGGNGGNYGGGGGGGGAALAPGVGGSGGNGGNGILVAISL